MAPLCCVSIRIQSLTSSIRIEETELTTVQCSQWVLSTLGLKVKLLNENRDIKM